MFEAAVLCLALNIYHESRGEPTIGQHIVAQVTMERAKWDNKNVCRVVTAPRQFSWTNNRGLYGKSSYQIKQTMNLRGPAWAKAKRIARSTIRAGKLPAHVNYAKNATHFHATHVKPFWTSSGVRIAQVGNHVFYRL